MAVPRHLVGDKQIVVEGKDTCQFVDALVEDLDLKDIQVHDFGGVSEIHAFMKAFVLLPGFGRIKGLGILRDAETSASGAFQSVCTALSNVALPIPPGPETFTATTPHVGAFIFPGSGSSGMLEDLCLQAIQSDPVLPCVDGFFNCAEQTSGAMAPPTHRLAKARTYAFLSTRERPHLRVGEAAKAGYWDLSDPAFAALRSFLRSL